VLFVSYNGLLEPLGASQVLPYVRGLARRGYRMSILSFERPSSPEALAALAASLSADGIAWRRLRYHKRPAVLSTLADVARGVVEIRRARRAGVRAVHARSHVPALMAHVAGRRGRLPFLFDHRGLLAEEYADGGVWRRGDWRFRSAERWERRFLAEAAQVVVLSERYAAELADPGRVTVIPCAVDLERFRPDGGAAEHDLVHAGSWSGLYLAEDTLRFFAAWRRRRPEATLLVLVPAGQPLPAGVPGVTARHARPDEVPALLPRARAGLSLRRAGRAQIAAAPVKVSEYLATGLPVVSSAGVGDLDTLLPARRAGVVLADATAPAFERAADALDALLGEGAACAARCRALASERYALAGAVGVYARVYERLLAPGGAPR
jgi:glycosyltransferase involved in cell wall biosynthesis